MYGQVDFAAQQRLLNLFGKQPAAGLAVDRAEVPVAAGGNDDDFDRVAVLAEPQPRPTRPANGREHCRGILDGEPLEG